MVTTFEGAIRAGKMATFHGNERKIFLKQKFFSYCPDKKKESSGFGDTSDNPFETDPKAFGNGKVNAGEKTSGQGTQKFLRKKLFFF